MNAEIQRRVRLNQYDKGKPYPDWQPHDKVEEAAATRLVQQWNIADWFFEYRVKPAPGKFTSETG